MAAPIILIVYHMPTGKHLRTIVSDDYPSVEELLKQHEPVPSSKGFVQMDAKEYAQHDSASFVKAAADLIAQANGGKGPPAKVPVSILDDVGNVVNVIEAYPDYPQVDAITAGVAAALIPGAKPGGKIVDGDYVDPPIPDISQMPVEVALAAQVEALPVDPVGNGKG